MTIAKVAKTVGQRYPKTPEDLTLYVERILGPVVDEIRTRYNALSLQLGFLIETDEAAIAALDATDMLDGTLVISSATRSVYSLDKAATVLGVGDLAASPSGAWIFEWAL